MKARFRNERHARFNKLIFDTDTIPGKIFDFMVIFAIIASVILVMLDSVESIHEKYYNEIYLLEWIFTFLFSVEYIIRLYAAIKPLVYARSFFGIIDLMCILPSFLSLYFEGIQVLIDIRVIRLIRIFRILKLTRFMGDLKTLLHALDDSKAKIGAFLLTIFSVTVIIGSLMYLVEGKEYGFTSIPQSIYWAVVTVTTVGYGDLTPHTPIGQALAIVIMFLGYCIIAIPTGIFTVELNAAIERNRKIRRCKSCTKKGHDVDASFCKFCGGEVELTAKRKRKKRKPTKSKASLEKS